MAILKIARMGNPVLHRVAEPVEDPIDAGINTVVSNMLETLHDSGGVGLAAPQVHVSKRIVIFYAIDNKEANGGNVVDGSLTVMINPEIDYLGSEKKMDWESCLSLPEFKGAVPRFDAIRYRWTDLTGKKFEREAIGFHARVVQHECDHLDGILYPMRVENLNLFGYRDEMSDGIEISEY